MGHYRHEPEQARRPQNTKPTPKPSATRREEGWNQESQARFHCQGGKAPKLLGAEDSATRSALLDATEQLVRDEGYGALSSRRIAEKAGLKHQLIYYYFDTLDDLLLAVLRRGAAHNREYHAQALNSDHPLRSLWNIVSDLGGTKFTNEFMALANHNKAIQTEIARHWNELRRMQVEAISRHVQAKGLEPKIPPVLIVVLMSAIARLMVNESALGIDFGHKEAEALVEESLRRFDESGQI